LFTYLLNLVAPQQVDMPFIGTQEESDMALPTGRVAPV
jgi:hypothetical protein